MSTQRNTTPYDATQHNTTQHNTTQHRTTHNIEHALHGSRQHAVRSTGNAGSTRLSHSHTYRNADLCEAPAGEQGRLAPPVAIVASCKAHAFVTNMHTKCAYTADHAYSHTHMYAQTRTHTHAHARARTQARGALRSQTGMLGWFGWRTEISTTSTTVRMTRAVSVVGSENSTHAPTTTQHRVV